MRVFPSLKLEGGLIAGDIIEQIADENAPGQKPEDFGLKSGHLTDEIAAVWAEARQHYEGFQHRIQRLDEDKSATTITRNQWVIPLLSLLGYELSYMPTAAVVDDKKFAISHRPVVEHEQAESAPPVHIVSCLQSLDRRPESGRSRMAPHSLIQQYLNRTEHLWGIITNGETIRLLRDSQLMSRFAYIEFDLHGMMESEQFSDFALFYRLVHRSRLPGSVDDAPDCLVEKYHQLTVEQGGRVRDRLRDGVESAIKSLANGFLSHSQNKTIREKVQNKELTADKLYQQLLKLIYRLLFLMVAEERNLITDNPIYSEHYSVSRLRQLAEVRSAYTGHDDLWLSFQTTLRILNDRKLGEKLGIKPLDGELFNPGSTSDLQELKLTNRDFLSAIWYLSMYREDEQALWRRVNYSALDVEELGSVYESLLDFYPVIEDKRKPVFQFVEGTERKSTGSYYTPRELVGELIKSALAPVVENKLEKERSEETLLSIKVCDPACGSGHFLLAAARYLGKELARIRTGEEEPGEKPTREAIRDVIAHCIYGVDLNPLSVDLCKVALWIEGHCKGKPLTFLDHRIKCGNSLIGILDPGVLENGIPNDAFKKVSGDDSGIVSELKKQNRDEKKAKSKGQLLIPHPVDERIKSLAEDIHLLDAFEDNKVRMIREKKELYESARKQETDWFYDWQTYNLWTAPFFADFTAKNKRKIPTSENLWSFMERDSVRAGIVRHADALAEKHRFFHWPLEFPDVFERGGFDVVLCNPPWERIKLQEKEFFANRAPEIANAPNRAARRRLIRKLPEQNPELYEEYREALHAADSLSRFLRQSGLFPLTARGDINTYQVFAGLFTKLIKPDGRAGVIIPTGIATDYTNREFFAELVQNGQLISLYDFENREKLFPAVDSRYKFCLLSLQGEANEKEEPAEFLFFATNVRHLSDEKRCFTAAFQY